MKCEADEMEFLWWMKTALAYAVLQYYFKDNHPFGIFCSFDVLNTSCSYFNIICPLPYDIRYKTIGCFSMCQTQKPSKGYYESFVYFLSTTLSNKWNFEKRWELANKLTRLLQQVPDTKGTNFYFTIFAYSWYPSIYHIGIVAVSWWSSSMMLALNVRYQVRFPVQLLKDTSLTFKWTQIINVIYKYSKW